MTWNAPAVCPGQDEVVGRIDAWLQGRPRTEPATRVDATARVQSTASGFALELSVVTEAGRRDRVLQSPDCDELANAAALLIAIALDPELDPTIGLEPIPTEPEPSEPEPSEPAPPVAVPPASTSEPSRPVEPPRRLARPRGIVRIASGLAVASLPGPAAALGAGLGLRWRYVRVEAMVEHRFRRRAHTGAATTDVWSTAAELSVCGVPNAGRAEFPLCVGFEGGALSGRSFGVSTPARGRGPWLASTFGAGVLGTLHRHFALGLEADLIVPLARTGFTIAGVGEVFRAPTIAADVVFVLEARFP